MSATFTRDDIRAGFLEWGRQIAVDPTKFMPPDELDTLTIGQRAESDTEHLIHCIAAVQS